METALAILLALAIYIGIPAAIGFAIVGAVVLAERRRRARAPEAEATMKEAKEEREPVGAGRKRG